MTEITTSSEAAEHDDVHRDTDTADSTPAEPVPVESNHDAAEEGIADAQSTEAPVPSNNVNVTATSNNDTVNDTVDPTPAQPIEIVAAEVVRHPQVAALHTLFPDFDDAVLISVLESVGGNQDRAIDTLLGMNDPDYVSQPAEQAPPVPSQTDLDEQLARRLMLEEQEQEQEQEQPARHRGPVVYDYSRPSQPNSAPSGRDTMAEFQDQFNKFAETGKKTIGSFLSKVKAKMSEFDQPRMQDPGWASGPGSSYQQYEQRSHASYYDPDHSTDSQPRQGHRQSSQPPQTRANVSSMNTATVEQNQTNRSASPTPPVATETPQPSQPPTTQPASNIDPGKIGLLPKRPVSLLQPVPPPVRQMSEDEELEYTENPFEDGGNK